MRGRLPLKGFAKHVPISVTVRDGVVEFAHGRMAPLEENCEEP